MLVHIPKPEPQFPILHTENKPVTMFKDRARAIDNTLFPKLPYVGLGNILRFRYSNALGRHS